MAIVIRREQEAWTEGGLVGMLLMDVKIALDYISRNSLLRTMEVMEIHDHLIR